MALATFKGEKTETGRMIVKTRTGFGMYPLEKVLVTLLPEGKEENAPASSAYTDETGSTPLLLVSSLGFTATALFLLFNKQAKEI